METSSDFGMNLDEIMGMLASLMGEQNPPGMFGYDSGEIGSANDSLYTIFEALVIAERRGFNEDGSPNSHYVIGRMLPMYYQLMRDAGMNITNLDAFCDSLITHTAKDGMAQYAIDAFHKAVNES